MVSKDSMLTFLTLNIFKNVYVHLQGTYEIPLTSGMLLERLIMLN